MPELIGGAETDAGATAEAGAGPAHYPFPPPPPPPPPRDESSQRMGWFVGAESLLITVYAFTLTKLAEISAQEPGTYPRENMPVASLAWLTAWAVPLLALGLCVAAFLSLAANLRRARSGGWALLLVPVLFGLFWFFVVRHQSNAIQNGIEHWRNIPQDQA